MKGQRQRNVYLPKIQSDSENSAWVKGSDGTLYKGGSWLNDTRVELDEILYFVRLSHDPLARPSFE
jgi:hypothetical protein